MNTRYGGLTTETQRHGEKTSIVPKWLEWTVNAWLWLAVISLIGVIVTCCMGCDTQLRGKGGQTEANFGIGSAPMKVNLKQPENPKSESKQDANERTEEHNSYPPGTTIIKTTPIFSPITGKIAGIETNSITVGGNPTNSTSNAEQNKTSEKGVETQIGAAYEDTVGKILATMKAIRWIQIVGIGLVLFGLASLFWPVLRAIVNSTPTSIAITAFGAALIFVTPFVSLHPGICVGIVAAVCAFIWLSHQHIKFKDLAKAAKTAMGN